MMGKATNILTLAVCVFFLAVNALSPAPIAAEQRSHNRNILVTVKKGQSIRDIAGEYLNDPDRWPDILAANKIKTAAAVKPGMKLKIPFNEITRANSMLVKSHDAIREATKYKARIFAPAVIDKAVTLREKAFGEKKRSRWKACYDLAKQSLTKAREALKICRSKTDVPTMAMLNDRKGDVEHRKPSALSWIDLPLKSSLTEGEKVRTLYRSFADILFHEGSHLRLDENSMAIIQRMRANLIQDKKESSVSLVKGNIYALLSGTANKKFNVKLKGVKTKIKSKNFWIGKKDKEVLLANYHGQIEVTARNSTVLLEKNKGTKVREAQKPTKPVDLLAGPELSTPAHNVTVYQNRLHKQISFSWQPVPEAAGYEAEMSYNNRSFEKIFLIRKNIKSPRFTLGKLKNGTYYWRVSAIDKNGFPGPKSKPFAVNVITDTTPPFIVVHSPKENQVIKEQPVTIKGETESGAALTFTYNKTSKTIKTSSSGAFEFTMRLDDPGPNGEIRFTLQAADPAENTHSISRTLIYMPEKQLDIVPDAYLKKASPGQPGNPSHHYIVPDPGFTFRGRTTPGIVIKVKDKKGPFKANIIPDKNGWFSFSVFLQKPITTFLFTLTDPAGRTVQKEMTFGVK